MAICQVMLLEMFREYALEELGRLHEEVIPKLVLKDEGRIKRSRLYKGVCVRCMETRTESL